MSGKTDENLIISEATPLHFSIPARHCRGRILRLDSVLSEILSAHDYPAVIQNILAEAVCLAALLGSLIKDDRGQMTMQAQTKEGPVRLLACDYRAGELRGYVDFDADLVSQIGPFQDISDLFGEGYLAITFDQPPPQKRYQGIVPLEGASLAEATQNYFYQSEQIPTLIKVALDGEGAHLRAGGLLVQHLPEGEEGRERLHVRLDHPEWEHVAIMTESLRSEELLDRQLPLDEILWRLFSESDEVRVDSGKALVKGCRCSEDHIRNVIARFPQADRVDMVSEDGKIAIDCAFCSRKFEISAASLNN